MKLDRIILLFILMLNSCQIIAQRNNYADVLSLRTSVTDTNDIEKNCFSDLGAWHAYALPQRKEDYGSFIGPLLMDMNGQWLSNNLVKLSLKEKGTVLRLDTLKASVHYYPGLLKQSFETNGLGVEMKLIFVSNRTSLLQVKIRNKSKRKRIIGLMWQGDVLLSSAKLQKANDGLSISFANKEHQFEIVYQGNKNRKTLLDGNSYKTIIENIVLEPGQDFFSTQQHRFFLQPNEKINKTVAYNFSTELIKNENRWNSYLKKYFLQVPSLVEDKKRLAVKSIVTLMTNWRSAAKDLLHDGVFPSVSYQGFYGVWSWDSWKQAVGLSYFNTALAKENIRCMFDYMDEYGMIADCIYTDKKENNWRDTKPPLAAWAVWNVYQQSKDIGFVKELYPKLLKYHRWWYANRDHDKNGLCEYGSTDGTRIAAAWESGMDNAVRFDSAVMIRNNEHAWSLNQESVDLNAYLYAEKIFLAKLAAALNKNREADLWKKEAEKLAPALNSQFFDESKGFYYDKLFGKKEHITVEGTEGWIPLWAGFSTAAQAESVWKIMKNKEKFNTLVPLPTFTASHPKFDPLNGYWRGPVWLDQFYFGVEGLKRYGYHTFADELKNKLFNNAEGLLGDAPIYENYHPLTGKGLNAINFSWSAAYILMMLKK